MLGIKNYTKEYIEGCRARVDLDLTAYRNLVGNKEATNKTQSNSPAFETTFFNNMVLLLDYFFVHRLRMIDGNDGNPLNEVRVICNSILYNHNIMNADKLLKLSP